MSKKETINKIMTEYSNYGISRIVVEISYLLAVLWRVPKESIYPGLKLTINNLYGVHDDMPAKEAGNALFNAAMDETKQDYPSATNKHIANAIELVGVENLEKDISDDSVPFMSKVRESIMSSTKEFVKANK